MSSGDWKNRNKTIIGHEYCGVRQSKRVKKPLAIFKKTMEKVSNTIIRTCWCGTTHGIDTEWTNNNGFRNYSKSGGKKYGKSKETRTHPGYESTHGQVGTILPGMH